MKNPFHLTYYDRATGELQDEHVFAGGFLYWSYNTRPGRFVTRWILAQRIVSRLCGWLARRRLSRHLIAPLARRMHLDLPALGILPEAFACFNDFFIRDLSNGSRVGIGGPKTCLSPVDGKLLVLRDLDPRESFRVKRSIFNLEQLLGDARQAQRFKGGTAVICRVGLSDYHHFHFPLAGVPEGAFAIPGKLYAGGPYATDWLNSFYADNYRMVTRINSDLFGTVAQVEIGAFTVGSIQQNYETSRHVEKGDKKGHFALGGSTVVLVFAAGAVEIAADLLRHSGKEVETRVQVGEPIGRVPGSHDLQSGFPDGVES